MPKKSIAEKIEDIRTHLFLAITLMNDLAGDELDDRVFEDPDPGRRHRMLKIAQHQTSSILDLLWELPGVNWREQPCLTTQKSKRRSVRRK